MKYGFLRPKVTDKHLTSNFIIAPVKVILSDDYVQLDYLGLNDILKNYD